MLYCLLVAYGAICFVLGYAVRDMAAIKAQTTAEIIASRASRKRGKA